MGSIGRRRVLVCAGVLTHLLVAGGAGAVFETTQFVEILQFEAVGTSGFVESPNLDVPYSIEIDQQIASGGGSLVFVGKSQTNGGDSPAIDLWLHVDASTGGQVLSASGIAQIFYEFRVDYTGGETPPVSVVPLVFDYRMSTEATAGGNCIGCTVSTGISLVLSDKVSFEEYLDIVAVSCNPQSCIPLDGRESSSDFIVRTLPAGQDWRLTLTAEATLADYTPSAETLSGEVFNYADPLIRFDPTFEYADVYAITVEPGSLQSNPDFHPVPEPRAGWLASAALVVVAWLRRGADRGPR
jgi:hypothetical protein